MSSPTDEELQAAKLEKNGDTYTLEYTTNNPAELQAEFTSYPEKGKYAYDLDFTAEAGGIYRVTVTATKMRYIIEGRDHEEEVDYGSDGEGNIDYADWTMERQANRSKVKKYAVVWEEAREWPPFKYGSKYLIPEDVWVGMLALLKGFKPGDEFMWEGRKVTACTVSGTGYNPDIKFDPTYLEFGKRKKIFVTTETRSWVVSSVGMRKGHLYADEKRVEDKRMKKLKWVSLGIAGNRDGKMGRDGEPTNATYTVTETTTIKEPYTGQKIPHGYTLEDATIEE